MKIIYFTSFWIHYVILGDQYCSRSPPLVFPRPLSGVYLRWRQSVSSPGSPSFPFWCHLRILCLFCIFRFSPAVVLFPFPRPRCRSRRYIFRYFPALLFHFPHILWNCLFFSLCCGRELLGGMGSGPVKCVYAAQLPFTLSIASYFPLSPEPNVYVECIMIVYLLACPLFSTFCEVPHRAFLRFSFTLKSVAVIRVFCWQILFASSRTRTLIEAELAN